MSERLHWVIEVCRHCGQLASWPGCQHWQSEAGWCVPVLVRTTPGEERKLREGFDAASRPVSSRPTQDEPQ